MNIKKKLLRTFRHKYLKWYEPIEDIKNISVLIDPTAKLKYTISFNLDKGWVKKFLPRFYHRKGRIFFLSDKSGHFQDINHQTKHLHECLKLDIEELLSNNSEFEHTEYPIEIHYYL